MEYVLKRYKNREAFASLFLCFLIHITVFTINSSVDFIRIFRTCLFATLVTVPTLYVPVRATRSEASHLWRTANTHILIYYHYLIPPNALMTSTHGAITTRLTNILNQQSPNEIISLSHAPTLPSMAKKATKNTMVDDNKMILRHIQSKSPFKFDPLLRA